MQNQGIVFILLLFLGACNILSNEPGLVAEHLSPQEKAAGITGKQRFVNFALSDSLGMTTYRFSYLSDKLNVIGFMVKPAHSKGKKYPVLIFNRDGSNNYGKIGQPQLRTMLRWAARGYVVLASQYRGNDGGEGQEEFGGQDVNDVVTLARIARQLPGADASRMAMLGHSRGGMMTYLAIKAGVPLRAAAVVSGPSDLIQMCNDRKRMLQLCHTLIGSSPRQKPEEYRKRSAYFWPEQLNVPLLIMHGQNDEHIHITQATKLSEKLRMAGKTHELVIVPKGSHALMETHREESEEKIFEWFKRHL